MPEVKGALIVPKVASAPGSPTAGQVYYDTTQNVLFWYNGTAWQSVPPVPACRVHNSTNLTAAGAGATTTLNFDTEDYDVWNMHNPASNPNRITVPWAGLYLAEFYAIATETTAAFIPNYIRFRRNGTSEADYTIPFNSTAPEIRAVSSHTFKCAVSDFLDLAYFNNGASGNTVTFSSFPPSTPYFQVTYLGRES